MMTSIYATLILLGIAIIFHEFGHFIIAKLFGIRVERFSVGFPPRLFGFKKGETDYCISAIPLGGYVKVTGQDPTEELTGEPYEFNSKPPWQRILVVLAGPLMNVITAYFMIVLALLIGVPALIPQIDYVKENSPAQQVGIQKGDLIYSVNGIEIKSVQEIDEIVYKNKGDIKSIGIIRNDDKKTYLISKMSSETDLGIEFYVPAEIGKVLPNTPASRSGLLSGDRILSVNGKATDNRWREVTKIIRDGKGEQLNLEIARKGKTMQFFITPEYSKLDDAYLIGITAKVYSPGLYYRSSFPQAISKGLWALYSQIKMILYGFKEIIIGNIPLRKALGGPQSIANIAGQSMKTGGADFLLFTAAISIMLGIINLFPIPVLDGGHILFHMIEWIRGKALSPKTWEISTKLGFAVLLTLMSFVIINDLISSGLVSRIIGIAQ